MKLTRFFQTAVMDSRLAEMERKIAADRAILAKYFGESGIMPDEALLEEKEEETDEEKDSLQIFPKNDPGNRDGKKKKRRKRQEKG